MILSNNKAEPLAKFLLLSFLLISFAACTGNESVIEGRVPDANYENEKVYLVPVKDASSKTVDSTLIREGRFQFKLKPGKQNRIFIVRVKPLLRLNLQDILIFSEPGTVYVSMDKNSSSSGTPLNQTLQQWKEKKHASDSTRYVLYRKYKEETDESEKARLQSEIEEVNTDYRNFADSLAERNKDNAVGQFIRSLNPTAP